MAKVSSDSVPWLRSTEVGFSIDPAPRLRTVGVEMVGSIVSATRQEKTPEVDG